MVYTVYPELVEGSLFTMSLSNWSKCGSYLS